MMRLRSTDVLGGQAEIGEGAVGGAVGCMQRLGMRGGKKNRRRALDPGQMRVAPPRLAGTPFAASG
jgi:hypothetical protein